MNSMLLLSISSKYCVVVVVESKITAYKSFNVAINKPQAYGHDYSYHRMFTACLHSINVHISCATTRPRTVMEYGNLFGGRWHVSGLVVREVSSRFRQSASLVLKVRTDLQ